MQGGIFFIFEENDSGDPRAARVISAAAYNAAMSTLRRLLLLTPLLLSGIAPRCGEVAEENATTIPIPAFQPLAGVAAPAEIPEKSRILMHDEIWELPDTMRVEMAGNMIYHFYEQSRIVQEVIIAGRDAGSIAPWHDFLDSPEQRLESFEGEIRTPDGRKIPLSRALHLLEKQSVTAQGRGAKDDAEGLPRKPEQRLWWLMVPGITPGAVIEFRAVMHYDQLDYLNRGFADGLLPADHYRLRVRSNQSLYVRKPGFWKRGLGITGKRESMKLTRERQADFNPRGKKGFMHTTHARWWADIQLLPRGTRLRAGAEKNGEDQHETEILADDLPAHLHETVQPDDDTLRPMVLAYFSTRAPATNLGYWETEYPKEFTERLREFLAEPPKGDELDLKAIAGEGSPEQRTAATVQWVRDHFSKVEGEKRIESFRVVLKQKRGIWYARHFLLAALLRQAGISAGLAQVFRNDDLPVIAELADDRFYAGPFLAVRVETAAGVEYYFPDERDLSGARVPAPYRGAVAYHFWTELPARRETIPAAAQHDDGERFRLGLKLNADGGVSGAVAAEFTGLTAARQRGRLKLDQPTRIEISAKDADRVGEILQQQRAADLERASVSAEALLKEKLGGAASGVKARPHVENASSSATLSGTWSQESHAAGDFSALVNPLGLSALYRKAERRYPVRDNFPEFHRLEFELELPAGKRPAQDRLAERIEGPGGYSFEVKAEFREGRWSGFWELREADREVPAADYPKLREAEQKAFELLQRKIPLLADKPARAPAPRHARVRKKTGRSEERSGPYWLGLYELRTDA